MFGGGLADSVGGLFLLVFAAAFPIVNPAGSALIFLDITRHLPHRAREVLARHIAFYSFLVLNGSLFIGGYLLEFFGISIPVLRVAGGIVVTAAGWRFLQEPDEQSDVPEDAQGDGRPSDFNFLGKAFYPLTMPITTGPGTISVMIALGSSHPTSGQLLDRVAFTAAALAANAGLAIIIYLCFAFADRLTRLLGNSATLVMMRLSAFILFCIGIQITWSGLQILLTGIAHG
jgi:multiple antibiotic resistance protein